MSMRILVEIGIPVLISITAIAIVVILTIDLWREYWRYFR